VVELTEGSLAGHLARWWACAGRSGPCRMSGSVEVVVRGVGLVKLRWRQRRLPSRSAPGPPSLALLLLLLLSLSLVRRRRKGKRGVGG
jgi:MYXO-CTERM domain-containing protein